MSYMILATYTITVKMTPDKPNEPRVYTTAAYSDGAVISESGSDIRIFGFLKLFPTEHLLTEIGDRLGVHLMDSDDC